MVRLTATIPPRGFHTVRYYGVFAPASLLRSRVVPGRPKSKEASNKKGLSEAEESKPKSRWRPWCELLARTFGIDVTTCPSCGGKMKLRVLTTQAEKVERYLRKLGLPTDLPPGRGRAWSADFSAASPPAAAPEQWSNAQVPGVDELDWVLRRTEK